MSINNNPLIMKTLTFQITFGSWKYNINKDEYDITTKLGLNTNSINNGIKIGAWNRITGTIPDNITNDIYNDVYYSICAQMVVKYTFNNETIEMTFHKVASHSNIIIDFMSPQTSAILNGGTGHFFWAIDSKTLNYDTPRPGAYSIDNIIEGSTLDITVNYL